jgi:Na+/proline symporter
VLRFWFLPRYLALGCRYPYEVVEMRFGSSARTFAAAMFVAMRIGWMAAMVFAPTMAILAMTRLDADRWFWPLVLATGLSSTLYAVFSGIRGVIVTDAIQFVVLAAGILVTISYALGHLTVPISTAWEQLGEAGRLNVLDFSLDPTKGITIWTVIIGVTIANLANYIGDQMSLQRYLATGDVKAASRSFLINVLGVMIVLALLAGVGLSLFVFYHNVHDPNLPARADKVFHYFVAHRLPPGLSGLLLAAILAATMSSMTSGINALSGVITLDFAGRYGPQLSERAQLRLARISSLLIGICATLAAGLVANLGTLFELTQVLLGVFAGPLLACIAAGTAGFRCFGRFMILGMFCGWLAGGIVALTPIAALWVAPVATVTTLIVAYGSSRLFGRFIATTPPKRFALIQPEHVE